MNSEEGHGLGRRIHAEPPDRLRGPFELDRHRIIECSAFRRLEGKTQVFAPGHHDHFRTRLTHTLEAAQIARTLAAALGARADLAEAITLAHDLGHPPFGHAGEAALDEAMAACGGFNHNAHSVRVVEYLEHPFPAFRGLNLTLETLTGLRSHCTRYDRPAASMDRNEASGGGVSVAESARKGLGEATIVAPLEASVASLADRIAYNCHDLEDAIGAAYIGPTELAEVELWREAWEPFYAACPGQPIQALRRPVLNEILNGLILDAVRSTCGDGLQPPEESTAKEGCSVMLSLRADDRLRELEEFLALRVYRRPEILEMDARGRSLIAAVFSAYSRRPQLLPERFARRIDEVGRDRVIGDFLAGMTDRYCTAEHARIVGR